MKIFIGSSTKNRIKADKIAKELERSGFEVYRWWDKRVFKGGDITISRLVQMSDICDGSVFVFGADDEIVVSREGKKKYIASPRDNVILEYGIFVGKHGVKKTLFVTEPNVKIPSDLNGVTYLGERGYPKRVADSLKETFREFTPGNHSGHITVHVNKKLIHILSTGGDPAWRSRSLYVGSRGANAWRAVETCPYYNNGQNFSAVHQLIGNFMRNEVKDNFDTIVSFGPGLGNLDKKIIPSIRGRQILRYIPVDINFYLANQAAEVVSESAKQIHVPFCIVGDFESGMSLISETIHEFSSPGRAFLMLGGTFGNLEDEKPFIEGLRGILQAGDIAILDVFTASDSYEYKDDKLLPLREQKSEAVKLFLANGIEGNCSREEILSNIDEYIETIFFEGDEGSDVHGTKTFEFRCKSSGRTLTYVRRYNHEEFRNFLEHMDFTIIADGAVNNSGAPVTHSVYIIKLKI